MDDNKKDAYLHLMHRAFIEVRLYSTVYCQIESGCSDPIRWKEIDSRLRQINKLANAFHNLPLYLKSNNTDFNEDSFWSWLESYEKKYGSIESYKSIFNKVVDGEKQ